MSETINNQPLIKDIKMPELNSSEFATKLSNVFENINDNFVKLANHDFIKGDTGDSVEVKIYNLADEENNIYKEQIKNCIKEHYNISDTIEDEVSGIGPFTVFNTNPGSIQMICKKKINDDLSTLDVPVSSLYYVFLDSRFANENIGKIDAKLYNDITDISCIITYGLLEDNITYGFKVLDNAFPTIYYESEIGLCWKINGNNTNLPVQGIPGKNGLDAKLFIVKGENAENTENDNLIINILSIFDGQDGFIPISNYDISSLELNKDYSALILSDAVDNKQRNFYFGTIKLDETGKIIGYSDTNNTINTLIQTETLISLFKSIKLRSTYNENNMPGIFIPIEYPEDKNDIDNTQSVHLMTSTSITNNDADLNKNTDIICTAVNDVNDLVIDETNQIRVDKYLYLRVDKNEIERLLKESWLEGYSYKSNNSELEHFITKEKINNIVEKFDSVLSKSNYILKYKLENTLYGKHILSNDEIFDFINTSEHSDLNNTKSQCLMYSDEFDLKLVPYFSNTDNIKEGDIPICLFNNITSLYKGYIPARDEAPDSDKKVNVSLLPDNSPKYISLSDENQYVSATRDYDSFNLIPYSFKQVLESGAGIYRWKLDLNYNEFDNKELKNCVNEENKYLFDADDNSILILFNTIFTDTVTPSETSKIMWFNGFSKDLSLKYGITIKGIFDKNITDKNLAEYYDPIGVEIEKTALSEGISNTIFYTDSYNNGNGVCVIKGWNYNSNELLKFVQFTPIFINDYKIVDDTALNINYNVNITGDSTNLNKNLSVNGAITSLEINTNTLNAAELKNIYTNDDIILGNNESKISFKPNNNDVNSELYTEINSSKISTQDINSYNVEVLNGKLNISNISNEDKKYSSEISYIDNNLNVSLHSEDKININLNSGNTDKNINIYTETNEDKSLNLNTNLNNISLNHNGTISSNNDINNVLSYVQELDIENINEHTDKEQHKIQQETIEYFKIDTTTIDGYNNEDLCYSNKEDNSEDNIYKDNLKFKSTRTTSQTDDYARLSSVITSLDIPLYNKDTKDVLCGLSYTNNNKFKLKENDFKDFNPFISISLKDKVFTFLAGIRAERMSGQWPFLCGDSKLTLAYRYSIYKNSKDTKDNIIYSNTKNVNITVKSFNNNSLGMDWTGQDIWGNDINSTRTKDRFYQFHFKTPNISISGNEYYNLLKDIANNITGIDDNNSYYLHIDIIAYISMHWHNDKKGIYQTYLTCPIYIYKFNNIDHSKPELVYDSNSSIDMLNWLLKDDNTIQINKIYDTVVWSDDKQNKFKDWSSDLSKNNKEIYYKYNIVTDSDNISFKPNLNICNSGFYIYNNYSENDNKEIVGIGVNKDTAKIQLFRRTLNDNNPKTIDINDLFNMFEWYQAQLAQLNYTNE